MLLTCRICCVGDDDLGEFVCQNEEGVNPGLTVSM